MLAAHVSPQQVRQLLRNGSRGLSRRQAAASKNYPFISSVPHSIYVCIAFQMMLDYELWRRVSPVFLYVTRLCQRSSVDGQDAEEEADDEEADGQDADEQADEKAEALAEVHG